MANINPHSTRPVVNRLTSLEIRDQISAYESIAQSHFDQAEKCKRAGLAEPCVRHNQRGLDAQWKANELRQVLAQRKAQRLERSAFVYKALEAQKLARIALAGRAS